MEAEDADVDAIARGTNALLDDEEGVVAGSDEEGVVDMDDYSSASSGDTFPRLCNSDSSDSEDYHHDNEAPPIPDEVETSDEEGQDDESEEEEAPVEWIRDQFRKYCEEFHQKHSSELTDREAAAV